MPAIHLLNDKRALRSQILTLRDQLSPGLRSSAEARITESLLKLPSYQQAHTILLTLPFGSEVSTIEFARNALVYGKALVLPRVNQSSKMLDLYVVRDLQQDVAPGTWNIPEPLPERCQHVLPQQVDWALIPGTAFDRQGRRLGYGGGYYDRLLPTLPPGTPKIAAAFALQIATQVPAGKYDQRVDIIVTEQEIIIPSL